VSTGAFLAGQGTNTSIRAGMSMAQIGEFSFIIASLGLSLGVVRDFLYPVAVAVSAITTLTTPYLVRLSEPFAGWVDRRLPRPLQTYSSLYASWVEDLARAHREGSNARRVRSLIRWLLLDAVILVAVTIGLARSWPRLQELAVRGAGVPENVAQLATWAVAFALAAPFVFGIFRVARGLAEQMARMALPQQGRLDLAAAPRRALVVTIEVAVVLLIGVPIVVITQPFLPPLRGALVLAGVLLLLGIAAWRSATNLQGHVTAGSEVLLSALRSRLPPEQATAELSSSATAEFEADRFQTATHLLPGIGAPQRFVVEEGHFGAGKTLAELALRGRTGATVLAITRGAEGIPAPSKAERLQVGDQLVLVGTRQATDAARRLLITGDDQGRP
jgi:CPA2 family monovalent cation:H+ antiporter-2